LTLEKYALRRRFVDIIAKLKALGYKAAIHQHPGGRMPDAHTSRYLVDFARNINAAKICLTCSSTLKCAYGKYVEIPMCRSLLAGDLPDERQEFFASFMLVIDPKDSDEQIIAKIEAQLCNLEGKTQLGYELSLDYKMEDYATRFLAIVERYMARKLMI
jgi:hypothetical protein